MRFIGLFLLLLACLTQCSQDKKALSPEDGLLNIFKVELSLVEQYQDDYIAYMQQQLQHFESKNRLTSQAIKEVNRHFSKMSEDEKEKYLRLQRKKFQPIIDSIYNKTRDMIIKQTAVLTPEKMAKVQEFAVKLEVIEKNTKMVKLEPLFFTVPFAVDTASELH